MSNIVENAYHNVPEPTVMSSNSVFCPISSPQPKYAGQRPKEKQQILTLSLNQQTFHIFA